MAFLGIRGTGSFDVNGQRPESWREISFYLNPNGKYPLNAILSMMESEERSDTIFNWFEEGIHLQRETVNGAVSDTTATSITLDSGAYNFKAGDVVLDEETGEQMRVSADPTSDTVIKVTRHFYGKQGDTGFLVTGTAIGDGDHIVAIGSAYGENAPAPSAITYKPSVYTNYMQNFRDPAEMTLIASRTKYRNTKNAWAKIKRDALDVHMTKMEKAFIWGKKTVTTDTSGQPMYTTDGILSYISTNDYSATAGKLNEAGFDHFLEALFAYGGTEKLAFCGARALNVIAQMAKNRLTVTAVPTDQTYGMNVTKVLTPFGTLYLKLHPLMALSSTWTKDMIFIQPEYLHYNYIFDTDFKRIEAAGGTHAKSGEFYTVAGLELNGEKAFGHLSGISSYDASADDITQV